MKRNLKTGLYLLLALCYVALLLSGCSSTPANSPAPDNSPAPVNNNTSDESKYPTPENPLELRITSPFPEIIDIGVGYNETVRMINENSGGALIAKVYYDGTLLAFEDTFQGISTGVADIGWFAPANVDSNLPLTRVFSMTYDYVPGDIFKQRQCILEAYNTIPELHEELAKYNLAFIDVQTCAPCIVATNKTSVTTLDDMRGLQINTIGIATDYFSSLGAAAVTLSAGDYYLSMERGVIDGMYDGITTFMTFQMIPLVNHVLVFGAENPNDVAALNGMSTCPNPTLVNLDTWNKLSPDQQRIVKEAFAYGIEKLTMDIYDKDTKTAVESLMERGTTFTYLTGEDIQPWLDAQAPVLQRWIDNTTSLGYPAQDIYDAVGRIYASAR